MATAVGGTPTEVKMVDKMHDFDNASLLTTSSHHRELAVGAGATIVLAVATSIAALVSLLIATHAAPANAGELGDIVSSGGDGSSIAAIVLTAVLAGWLRVTADLWRAVFNRVRTWNLFRA